MRKLFLAILISVVFFIATIVTGCFYSPSPPRQEPAKPQRGPVSYIGPDLDGSDGVVRGRDYKSGFSRDFQETESDDSVDSAEGEYEYIFESIRPMEPVIEEEPEDEAEQESGEELPMPEPATPEGFTL